MDAIRTLLLRHRGLVFLDEMSQTGEQAANSISPTPTDRLDQLETELLDLGYLLGGDLHQGLSTLPRQKVKFVGDWICATIASELGADRPHVPLFRSFPQNIPGDTRALYVRRVLSYLLQEVEQPCLFCDRVDTVAALNPCGHLVCNQCWDGSNYSACPICYRRLSLNEPFLRPSTSDTASSQEHATLTVLHLGGNSTQAAQELFQQLVSRQTALAPHDRDDFLLLLQAFPAEVLSWIPDRILVKETMALLFGTVLQNRKQLEAGLAAAKPHLRTATDVLRVAIVWLGGAADLIEPPKRLASMPRALRRGLLEILEHLKVPLLIEDINRHAALWKRLAETLHPFEFHTRYPHCALAFAVLRQTAIDSSTSLGQTLKRAAEQSAQDIEWHGSQLRFRSWAAKLEQALRSPSSGSPAPRQLDRALALLQQRPGEFLRRLDHLLRLVVHEQPELLAPLLQALPTALERVASPILLTVLAHLRVRHTYLTRRVFFPRGNVAHAWGTLDRRSLLPPDVIQPIAELITQQLLQRAATQLQFPKAILDVALQDLLVPFNERTSSRTLIAVPRGSNLPISVDKRLRLFVHWMESEQQRIDLDLSVALYDLDWRFKGMCDYTHLIFANQAAIHSGDLTSAPAPLGASEFVDLDFDALLAANVRYLVVIIFSYNNIPFDEMPDAFAGFMLRDHAEGKVFDARVVAQRFDLQGNTKIAIPMLVDLETRRMRWVDVKLPAEGLFHNVIGYHAKLAHLGYDLSSYFGAGDRPSLWELACLHAAARTATVQVRYQDGSIGIYHRDTTEAVLAFYHRLVELQPADAYLKQRSVGTEPTLIAVFRNDFPVPDRSSIYALYRQAGLGATLQQLTAGDLVAGLAMPTGARSEPSQVMN